MSISPRHTHTRREGPLVAISVWGWIILSSLIRRGDRAAGRREDSPVTMTPLASSSRPEPTLPREPGRPSRLEKAAAWTQIVALPLAVLGIIYAGLAYSRQAEDAQQALAAIRVQQASLRAQQQTVKTLQESIIAQIRQVQAARLSAQEQRQLVESVRQLAAIEKQLAALEAARGGGTP